MSAEEGVIDGGHGSGKGGKMAALIIGGLCALAIGGLVVYLIASSSSKSKSKSTPQAKPTSTTSTTKQVRFSTPETTATATAPPPAPSAAQQPLAERPVGVVGADQTTIWDKGAVSAVDITQQQMGLEAQLDADELKDYTKQLESVKSGTRASFWDPLGTPYSQNYRQIPTQEAMRSAELLGRGLFQQSDSNLTRKAAKVIGSWGGIMPSPAQRQTPNPNDGMLVYGRSEVFANPSERAVFNFSLPSGTPIAQSDQLILADGF